MKDYQTMDLQTSALNTLAFGYKALSDRLQVENQALKTELKQLHQQLAQLALEAEAPVATPAPPAAPAPIPWWKRHFEHTG